MRNKWQIWLFDIFFLMAIIWGKIPLREGFGTFFVLSHSSTWVLYLYVISTYAIIIPLLMLSLLCPKLSGVMLSTGALISFFSGQISGLNTSFMAAFKNCLPVLCLGIIILLFGDTNGLYFRQLIRELLCGRRHLKPMGLVLCVLIGFLVGFPIGRETGIVWASCLESVFITPSLYMWGSYFIIFATALAISVMSTLFLIKVWIDISGAFKSKNQAIEIMKH